MSSVQQLVSGLNKKQKEAVLHTEGPLLIMAGAGSGKTRVLTHRMAYILSEKQVNPWNILAITFTNKAAKEMKERVTKLVGDDANNMWVSTFHSMCVRILRREAEAIGLSRSFTIADPAEQQTLIKRIIKEKNLDSTKFDYRMILSKISDAKNNLQTPAMFRDTHSGYADSIVADCYVAYQRGLNAAQSLDFDDLIMNTVQLFKQHEDILKYYQHKFHYIHVDEYQDTNEAQYELVKMLAAYHKNVCVVGDADQSIYGWRGANMENILNFENDYPNAQVVLLEQNYRSTKNILTAANSVIKNNTVRKEKRLWTDNEDGAKISYYRAQSEQDESHYVISQIQSAVRQKGYNYGDIAILYRTNAQSRVIEENLVKANLPYKIVGGLKFYDRKEIKDILAYLRLLANPQDNLSFRRVINEPKRGIGPGTLAKLEAFAVAQGISLLQAAALVDYTNVAGKAASAIKGFAAMFTTLQKQREFLTITELTEQILEQSNYLAALVQQRTLEADARVDNIHEFLSVTAEFDKRWVNEVDERQMQQAILAQEEANRDFAVKPVSLVPATDDQNPAVQQTLNLFETDELMASLVETVPADLELPAEEDRLLGFITDLALVSDLAEENADQQGQLTLMTLHAAKGLEFPIVFIVGLEEGLFPSSRAIQEDGIEEERRLAYVGITRAEQKLFLTNSFSRLYYGRYQSNPASRFIAEIDDDIIEVEGDTQPTNNYRQSTFGANGAGTATYGAASTGYRSYAQQNKASRAPGQPYQSAFKAKAKPKAQEKRSIFSQAPKKSSGESTADQASAWKIGDKALHKKWGAGTVVKVTGSGTDQELDIAFPSQGIKRLLAAFAPIEKQ